MNIDIRKSIINNFKNNNINEIKDSIIGAINDSEEITLPGLGVFFEILWNELSEDEKDEVCSKIHNHLKNKSL